MPASEEDGYITKPSHLKPKIHALARCENEKAPSG